MDFSLSETKQELRGPRGAHPRGPHRPPAPEGARPLRRLVRPRHVAASSRRRTCSASRCRSRRAVSASASSTSAWCCARSAATSRRCPSIPTLVARRAADRALRLRRAAGDPRQGRRAATCCSPPRSSSIGAEPEAPTTTATRDGDGWRIDGVEGRASPARPSAELVLVPAHGRRRRRRCSSCRPNAAGVTLAAPADDEPRAAVRAASSTACTSATTRCSASLEQGAEILAWTLNRTTVAIVRASCRVSPSKALRITAQYTTERKQFDRAIGTFQAVGQRMADCFIDKPGASSSRCCRPRRTSTRAATTRSRSRPRSSGRPRAATASRTPRCTSTAASASTSTSRSTATSCGSSSTSSRSARPRPSCCASARCSPTPPSRR